MWRAFHRFRVAEHDKLPSPLFQLGNVVPRSCTMIVSPNCRRTPRGSMDRHALVDECPRLVSHIAGQRAHQRPSAPKLRSRRKQHFSDADIPANQCLDVFGFSGLHQQLPVCSCFVYVDAITPNDECIVSPDVCLGSNQNGLIVNRVLSTQRKRFAVSGCGLRIIFKTVTS